MIKIEIFYDENHENNFKQIINILRRWNERCEKKKGNKNDNWFDSMNQENSSTKKLLFLPDRVPEFFFYV